MFYELENYEMQTYKSYRLDAINSIVWEMTEPLKLILLKLGSNIFSLYMHIERENCLKLVVTIKLNNPCK